jgi:hypothetical protein
LEPSGMLVEVKFVHQLHVFAAFFWFRLWLSSVTRRGCCHVCVAGCLPFALCFGEVAVMTAWLCFGCGQQVWGFFV